MKRMMLAVAMCASVAFAQTVQQTQENPKPAVVDVRGDAGIQALQDAQATPGGEHYKAGESAQNLLNNWLRKDGYKQGWDPVKKRYISIGENYFTTDEPASDPSFCLHREIALQRALLDARAKVAEFCNIEMDGELQAEIPGTELNTEFGRDLEAAQRRLDAQKQEVVALLQDVDKAQAEALKGATVGDRINATWDAAIKKLDATYDKANIEQEKKTKLENAKKEYRESRAEIQKLGEEIKNAKASIARTFNSKESTLAKMPLFGSTCIYQTESWDSKKKIYTVNAALVWSVGLEKSTRAIIQGQDVVMDAPKKGVTFEKWLESQDLGAMIGPRTFMDEKGQRWFIGIAARPLVDQPSKREKNRLMARTQADFMAVFSLRADMEIATTARQMSQTISKDKGQEVEQGAEDLATRVSAKIKQQHINGLERLREVEAEHTLTGIKMAVAISGISPDSVRAGLMVEEQSYMAAVTANKENSRRQGRKDQLEASKEASKNDRASYVKGRADANSALAQQEADRAAVAAKRAADSKQAEAVKAKETSQTKTLDGAAGSKPSTPADDF